MTKKIRIVGHVARGRALWAVLSMALISPLPLLAQQIEGPVRRVTVRFAQGHSGANGFASAAADVRYALVVCAGSLHISREIVRGSGAVTPPYWLDGIAYQIPDGARPTLPGSVRFSGVVYDGGRQLGTFNGMASDAAGLGCFTGDLMRISSSNVVSGRTPEQVANWLASLQVKVDEAPPYQDPWGVVSAIREKIAREKREAAQRAAEEERKARAAEVARRDSLQRVAEEERRKAQAERDSLAAVRAAQDSAARAEAARQAEQDRLARERAHADSISRAQSAARKASTDSIQRSDAAARLQRQRSAESRAADLARSRTPEQAREIALGLNWLNQNTTTTNRIADGLPGGRLFRRAYSIDFHFAERGLGDAGTFIRWSQVQNVIPTNTNRLYVAYDDHQGDMMFQYVTPSAGVSASSVAAKMASVAAQLGYSIKQPNLILNDVDESFREADRIRQEADALWSDFQATRAAELYQQILNGGAAFDIHKTHARARLQEVSTTQKVEVWAALSRVTGVALGPSMQPGTYFKEDTGLMGISAARGTRHFVVFGDAQIAFGVLSGSDEDDVARPEQTLYALSIGSTLPFIRVEWGLNYLGFHVAYVRHVTDIRPLNLARFGINMHAESGSMVRLDVTYINGKPMLGGAVTFNVIDF